MSKYKFVMRQIGEKNEFLGVLPVQEVEEYLEYQAQGYELHSVHYLGEVRNAEGTGVAGYRFSLWFVKSDQKAK